MDEKRALAIALQARAGIIWVTSDEELRVERIITSIAVDYGYNVQKWSCTRGIEDIEGTVIDEGAKDPLDAIKRTIKRDGPKCVTIFRDLGELARNDYQVARALRDANRLMGAVDENSEKGLVVVDTTLPPPTIPEITLIEWPRPDREAMEKIVKVEVLGQIGGDKRQRTEENGHLDQIVSAALGLTSEEACIAMASSMIEKDYIDPMLVAAEKKKAIQRNGVLEWCEPIKGGLDMVGGLDNLKEWLAVRRAAFTAQAREYGLPPLKGALLVGLPGCGKSLTAKCVAATWEIPLLRLDMGAVFQSLVGESEHNLRKALSTIESISPCVLWLDEVDKGFAGSTGAENDGGTSQRVLGTFLTWSQERESNTFIVATANDISALPAALLRAGRWDETFFVDLPNTEERQQICEIMRKKYPKTEEVDTETISSKSEGYSGAEIETSFTSGMFNAFRDNMRNVNTADVMDELARMTSTSISSKEQVESLREWGSNRARPASKQYAKTSPNTSRRFDGLGNN